MKVQKTTGVALAIAAAGLFSVAPMMASADTSADVKCFGVNKCKGQGQCKSAKNSCKGHNSCKGQGFIKMSKEECDKAGGKEGE